MLGSVSWKVAFGGQKYLWRWLWVGRLCGTAPKAGVSNAWVLPYDPLIPGPPLLIHPLWRRADLALFAGSKIFISV